MTANERFNMSGTRSSMSRVDAFFTGSQVIGAGKAQRTGNAL
jgi:hypothetical protein